VTLLKQNAQETWGWSWIDRLQQDLRQAVRQLNKAPGFALTVVLTLAIGIGANLAVFQLLHGVLFAQLPIVRPSQLYSLRAVKSPFDEQWFYSYPAYKRLREATGTSAPVIARSGLGRGVLQVSNGLSQEASFQLISDNFFDVMGLSPFTGRLFQRSDDMPGQPEVPVVLRYGFAKEHFSSARSVVGMKAVLNRVPIVVVGVAPERFFGVVQGAAPDLWLPLAAQSYGRFGTWFDSLGPGYQYDLKAPYRSQDGIFWLWVLGRVSDTEKASAENRWTQALQPDLSLIANATKDPKEREHIRGAHVQLISAAGGEGSLSAAYMRPLFLLMGMAALVFLVGCINLANLQLARLAGRQREIALRIALGASRWRVLRQLLVEDSLLVAIGGVLALATCGVLSSLLLHWASGRQHALPLELTSGSEEFLVGAGLLITALIGFSLFPAWQITRDNIEAAIQPGMGNRAVLGSKGRPWSSLLLAGQVSLSLLLLSMATLFARTLLNLSQLDTGLDREHVLSVHLDLVSGGLDRQDPTDLNKQILNALRALPFVRDASMQMCRIPGCIWNTAIHVSGRPELPEAQMHGEENHVSVGFFQTLGIPLLQGRTFVDGDRKQSQPVAILNHAFAQKLFGSESPVGHYIGYKPAPGDHRYLIVGEVGDARVDGLRLPAPPVAYFSSDQGADPAGTIEVRAVGSPANIAADIRRSLQSVDPSLPIAEIVPLNTEFEDGLLTEKLLARLTAIFAGLTLALAAIGFYGLLSFHVARRTSEIGVRMAMGATRAQVQGLFLRQTLFILLAGFLPGIVLTEMVGRTARTLLYGVRESDPWALLLAICVLLLSGVLATLIPARRAASLDPVKALRSE
jgi:predicted permease